jgi:hypothetical protein
LTISCSFLNGEPEAPGFIGPATSIRLKRIRSAKALSGSTSAGNCASEEDVATARPQLMVGCRDRAGMCFVTCPFGWHTSVSEDLHRRLSNQDVTTSELQRRVGSTDYS